MSPLAGFLDYPKTITALLLILQFGVRRYLEGRRRKSRLPLPPGPKGYPIIGNMFDIPSKHPEYTYQKLAERYGDLVYLESMGTKILIVSSLQGTRDLFDTRSSIYSSRWEMPMLTISGYGDYMSQVPYGLAWRRQRQLFHQHFNGTVIDKYHPMILDERVKCIQELLEHPKDFAQSIRSMFTTMILRSMYGIQPSGPDDPFITIPAETMEGFMTMGVPGAFFVDIIPALRHVPDWMPGTGWKKVSRHFWQKSWQSRSLPYNHVEEQMRKGTAEPSALSAWIEDLPPVGDPLRQVEEDYARNTAAVGYLAGSDTSLSTSLAAFILLACNPEVQKRAQKEIDEVVGFGRLPDFSDRDQLVYVNAIVKEVFRMHQPLPMGLPHSTTEDDVYQGYFIPKGTLVMGASWHILHDPKNFPDPFTFKPERFIKNGELNQDIVDPFGPVFGYGRRICPGRHFSIDGVFALLSSTLAMFDISAPKDEHGNPALKLEVTDGIVVAPKPFDCLITPRSPKHAELTKSLYVSDS